MEYFLFRLFPDKFYTFIDPLGKYPLTCDNILGCPDLQVIGNCINTELWSFISLYLLLHCEPMKPSMFYHVALTDWDGGLYTYDGPNLCENGYISVNLHFMVLNNMKC